ncbi:MAG: fibronectin type III domain-containing protein, partial [Spirochaetaceae bacterium]|nr:fibronectin type III domain-containing protein [Spirochaetaceae bacterium]
MVWGSALFSSCSNEPEDILIHSGEERPVPLNEPPALTPKVSPLDKSIEVTWNEVPGAKLYNVYWAESKPGAKPEETDKNSAPIIKDTSATIKDGIDNGKTYGVRVEAVNESGGTIVISDTVSCIPAVLHTNIGKAELEKLIETDIPASPEIYHRIKFDRDITINRLSTLFDKTVYLAGPAEGECVIS